MLTTRLDIINYLIEARHYTSYLEIGMDNPAVNFIHVKCAIKESVDPYDVRSQFCTDWTDEKLDEFLPYLTYRMTSDEFFATYPQSKYDLIFIDGLHLEHQVDRDIHHALEHLNPGGAVVIHDCLPITPQSQSEENPTGDWVGTVWRSIVKYTLHTPCDVKVINADWGVGIIEYIGDTNFTIPKHIDLDYDYFVVHKDELMRIYDWKQIRFVVPVSDKSVCFYPQKLKNITEILLSNQDVISEVGLFNGKMGFALYFYWLNRATGIKSYENIVGELCENLQDYLQKITSWDFIQGLTGVGWAVNHLILQGYFKRVNQNVLDDIDLLASRYFTLRSKSLTLITSFLLYGVGRLDASVKHICPQTRRDLLDTVKIELEFLIAYSEKYPLPINYDKLKDLDTTWYFPWLLWCVIQLKQFECTYNLSETLLTLLRPQIELIQQNQDIHCGNHFFLHLVLANGGYDSSFETPSRMWELMDNPSIKQGIAGIVLLLKLFVASSDYPELRQKLSNKLSELEDPQELTGYRWKMDADKNHYGLLDGLSGIGLVDLL